MKARLAKIFSSKTAIIVYAAFTLYTAVVFSMQSVFITGFDMARYETAGIFWPIVSSALFGLLIAIALVFFANVWGLDGLRGVISGKTNPKKWFVIALALSLAALAVPIIAAYPGAFSPDTYKQAVQAGTGVYNDWHPVIHTLLFFTLPMKLFGSIAPITVFQALCFSLAFAYLIYTMAVHGAKSWFLILDIAFVLVSPYTLNIMTHVWKDCAFAISAMIFTAFCINCVFSKGTWIKKPVNIILTALVFTLCSTVRHNGILFSLPMLLIIVMSGINVRRAAVVLIACVVAFCGIKFGVNLATHAEKPDRRVSETTGLCMAVMANAYVNENDRLPDDIKAFMTRITSDANIKRYGRNPGDFNTIKKYAENIIAIDNTGAKTVIRYALRTVKHCPLSALQAFFGVTGMVWQTGGQLPDLGLIAAGKRIDRLQVMQIDDYVPESLYGPTEFQEKLLSFHEWTSKVLYHGFLSPVFRHIGLWQLVILLFCAIRCAHDGSVKAVKYALPMFVYNFGTALLLTGYDWRFFFYSVVISVPTVFLIIKHPEA